MCSRAMPRRCQRLHFDAAVVRRSADLQHSSAGHGIAGVQEKIQEDLLQLVG